MKNSVLITGAGGFLGSHLSENFLKQGYNVICVDNFCTGLRSNQNYLENLSETAYKNCLKFIVADVTESWTLWEKNVPTDWWLNLKYIFHFASPASPPHYQRLGLETLWVNTTGLNNCIIKADQYKARVIFASTSEVYGDPSVTPQPESYWGNVNSYGERSCYDEAKRFGEALIFTHNKKFNTNHGMVRIFNTYGPRMNPNDGRVVINFIVQALKNQPLTVYGDGLQTRSFCYVADLIRAIQLYAQSSENQPINIGNPREFTMLQLAEIVIQKLDSKSQLVFKDLPADDPKQRRPDLSRAQKHLDYSPEVPLEEGVLKMAEWLKTELLGNASSKTENL